MVPPFFIVSTQQSISAVRWWKRPDNDNATKMIISMMARLEYKLVREATDVLLRSSITQIGQWSSLLVADNYLSSDGTISPPMAAAATLASLGCHCPLVPTSYPAAATVPTLAPAAAKESPSTGPQQREEERAEYVVGWASLQLPDHLDNVAVAAAANGEEGVSTMALYITARPSAPGNVPKAILDGSRGRPRPILLASTRIPRSPFTLS
jgi:hypothetical protein